MVSEGCVQTSNGQLGRCIEDVFCTTQTLQTRVTNTLGQLEPKSHGWLEFLVAFRSLPTLQQKEGGSFWLLSVVASGTFQISEGTVCLSKHTTSHLRFHSLLKSRSAGNISTPSILLILAGFS